MTQVRDRLRALVTFQQSGTFSNQARGVWARAPHTNTSIRVGCSRGILRSVQCSRSVMSDYLRPKDCSRPGLPVHHQLLELTQTHVH